MLNERLPDYSPSVDRARPSFLTRVGAVCSDLGVFPVALSRTVKGSGSPEQGEDPPSCGVRAREGLGLWTHCS